MTKIMDNKNPTLQEYLPALWRFVKQLSDDYQEGEVAEWVEMVSKVDNFFIPQNQKEIEDALPGWDEMTFYAGGLTRVHTIGVLVAIMTSHEYQESTDEQKDQMEWSGLLHDISKRVIKGQPDLTHAFRSAAQAARTLIRAGFWHQEHADLNSWISLTIRAVKVEDGREIQDNSRLPEILAGLDEIFWGNQGALVILKSILFHWSFTTVQDWPCATPLHLDEIRKWLDDALLQVLGPLILADSDSWNLFDHKTKVRYHSEITVALQEIGALLETPTIHQRKRYE